MRAKKTKSKKSKVNHAKNHKKKTTKKKIAAKKTARRKASSRRVRGRASGAELVTFEQRGLGALSGGQSGDTQGLSGVAETDSESVEELLEEGQSFEAEVVQGMENARDPDESEVRTSEVAEDDVPGEYRERE